MCWFEHYTQEQKWKSSIYTSFKTGGQRIAQAWQGFPTNSNHNRLTSIGNEWFDSYAILKRACVTFTTHCEAPSLTLSFKVSNYSYTNALIYNYLQFGIVFHKKVSKPPFENFFWKICHACQLLLPYHCRAQSYHVACPDCSCVSRFCLAHSLADVATASHLRQRKQSLSALHRW